MGGLGDGYFLDHAAVLPGRPSGEVAFPPPHCSYARETLVALGGFPEGVRTSEGGTEIGAELTRRGHRAYHAQDVRMVYHSRCRTAHRLVRHHVQRGREAALVNSIGHRPVASWRDPLTVPSAWATSRGGLRRPQATCITGATASVSSLRLEPPACHRRSRGRLGGLLFETMRAARMRGPGLAQLGFAGTGD